MKMLVSLMLLLSSCNLFTNKKDMQIPKNEQQIINAVEANDTIAVKELLQTGISVNTSDRQKRSLLLIATNNRNVPMAEMLVRNGANVNQQAENQDSPFLYAGASGQTELVQLYLNHGARFDLFNRYNGTALIPACERGHVATVRLLAFTEGYPINHINRLGWTALMEAIILGDGSEKYQQIVQILKDAGANMNIPDNLGITPLQHAENMGFRKIAEIIRSN